MFRRITILFLTVSISFLCLTMQANSQADQTPSHELGPADELQAKPEIQAKKPFKSPVLEIVESSGKKVSGGKQEEQLSWIERMTREDLEVSIFEWLIKEGLKIGLILILAVVSMKLANVFAKNTVRLISKDREETELKKRATTVSSVVRYLLIGGIGATAIMMILKELKIDIAPILAGAGVLTLAAGFGAQSLVKDVISGFFILIEDQIRVGDVITVADKTGTVEKVTLRMVALRDIRGNIHYIPSGEITVVTNMTKDYSRYVFDIGVAYREDTDKVIEIIKSIDKEIRSEADSEISPYIKEELEIMGLQRFEASAVIIRARVKTDPGKQWQVGREYNRRLKQKFDLMNIEIPFPHMTIYPGQSKEDPQPQFTVKSI